jgi:hypothetical protein
MSKTISVLVKEFIEGFRKKVDLNRLDTIEVYDENLKIDVSDSLTGIYGWGDDVERDDIFGYSIVWEKNKHSVTDVMEEIKDQLQNEYVGEIEPIIDGIRLVLQRIKK